MDSKHEMDENGSCTEMLIEIYFFMFPFTFIRVSKQIIILKYFNTFLITREGNLTFYECRNNKWGLYKSEIFWHEHVRYKNLTSP